MMSSRSSSNVAKPAIDSVPTSRSHLHRSKSIVSSVTNSGSVTSASPNNFKLADSPRSVSSSSKRARKLTAHRRVFRSNTELSSMTSNPFAEATSSFRPITSGACFGYLMDSNRSYARLPPLREPTSASCGGIACLVPYRFEFYGFSDGELLQKWDLQVVSSKARINRLVRGLVEITALVSHEYLSWWPFRFVFPSFV